MNNILEGATNAMELGTCGDAVAKELDPIKTPNSSTPTERGFAPVEDVSDMVNASERATTRRLVVSTLVRVVFS